MDKFLYDNQLPPIRQGELLVKRVKTISDGEGLEVRSVSFVAL
jgi:hypothetical protein